MIFAFAMNNKYCLIFKMILFTHNLLAHVVPHLITFSAASFFPGLFRIFRKGFELDKFFLRFFPHQVFLEMRCCMSVRDGVFMGVRVCVYLAESRIANVVFVDSALESIVVMPPVFIIIFAGTYGIRLPNYLETLQRAFPGKFNSKYAVCWICFATIFYAAFDIQYLKYLL